MLYQYKDKKPSVGKNVFIAPGAQIIGDVTIEDGASIWFNAVLRGDMAPIKVGANTSIQDNAVIHVDEKYSVNVGSNVTVGHSAIVHGCEIGDQSLIGMGSKIFDGAVIGESTLIGGGTVVPEGKEIPAKVLGLGVPARVIRDLNAEEIERLKYSAEVYKEKSVLYLSSLKQLDK